MSCYIAAYGLVSALGMGRDASAEALLAWQQSGVSPLDRHRAPLLDGRQTPVGRVEGELPAIPAALAPYASRNNQLLLAALAQVRPALDEALAAHGPARVGLVLGT
ncbi:TPA: beta-ketoacyl-ACP synthase, partial [Aeromonas hydrophila]|nr:beta-ketoacyl-ACP synthase [Aeromonas hydrophila]HEA3135635.1 beta-ketoacyl-ACP synthase [Aeromonas hydrophila]